MNPHLRSLALVLALVTPAACNDSEKMPEAEPQPQAEQPMAGMEGMQGAMGMMGQMQSHMQMMQGMSGDSMKATLPMHRQMVANMLSQMNREMREINMTTDAAWNATVDSVRQDLTRMPELSGDEMQAAMPGHHRRVMRLMEMHKTMMSGMRM